MMLGSEDRQKGWRAVGGRAVAGANRERSGVLNAVGSSFENSAHTGCSVTVTPQLHTRVGFGRPMRRCAQARRAGGHGRSARRAVHNWNRLACQWHCHCRTASHSGRQQLLDSLWDVCGACCSVCVDSNTRRSAEQNRRDACSRVPAAGTPCTMCSTSCALVARAVCTRAAARARGAANLPRQERQEAQAEGADEGPAQGGRAVAAAHA